MPSGDVHHHEDHKEEAIAIVGAACRLPGGIDTLDGLWAVLRAGRDVIGDVPPERFDIADFVDPGRRRAGKSYTAAGGFLEDVSGFDADFFGISPREATRVDPQQRLLLEMAVEALDDAGMCRDTWAGADVGVFVGASSRDYADLQSARPATMNAYSMTGVAASVLANRLSHAFDWHGESVAVDTACSSSLFAVHRACDYLRASRGPVALAGGVNVLLNPFGYVGFSAASMLSPTGRCQTFSAAADGFVRSEGGGVILLKRLGDALADGDRIHGTIVTTGANCDGRTHGLALPNPRAQEALLRSVYDRGRVHPDDLVYFEAHGTGTSVGDPAECEAIGRALGARRTDGDLPIGSVKSNVGHLEPASGMAGLFKALLVLRHGVVPRTLHAEPLNPGIDFARWKLRPAVKELPLPSRPRPVVGVNSFGFGGANAHAVLAPPPSPRPAKDGHDHGTLPVMVSAHTPVALAEAARRMAGRLRATSDPEFYDLAHTACRRRTPHRYRAVVLATDREEAAAALGAVSGGRREGASASASVTSANTGRTALVFSGNGSQWAGMGTGLLTDEPAFHDAVQRVDAALGPELGWSVHEALAAGAPGYDLRRTEVAQPLLFAVQMGLVAVLRERGVRFSGVAGHSVGEIAAACTAGALDLATAARVVAARSRAQAPTAGHGRMAAVGLPEDEARVEAERYGGRLTVAGVNSDRDVTLAGDPASLADLGEHLARRDVFFRMLELDYAFHSPAMDPIEGPLRALLGDLRTSGGSTPFYSSVSGGPLPGERLDAGYWWRNVREPVRFADAVRAMREAGHDVFVEVGPHPVLAPYLRRLGHADGGPAVIRTCRRDGDGPLEVRRAVAQLIAAGGQLDWDVYFPVPGRVADLPAYPWQRERHWNGAPGWWSRGAGEDGAGRGHPLLGTRLAALEPLWSGPVATARMPWLGDHKVGDTVVLPAAAYLEAAFAAAAETFEGPVEVRNLQITRPLSLPWDDDSAEPRLQVSLSDEDQLLRIAARHETDTDWLLHARGRVRRLLGTAPAPDRTASSPGPSTTTRVEKTEHYARAARAGLPYGPAFQVIGRLTVGTDEVVAAYETGLPLGEFRAHPAILDGALQAGMPLMAGTADPDTPFLPTVIETARLWQSPPARGWIHVTARERGPVDACWDVSLLDDDGHVTVELQGCRLRRFTAGGSQPVVRWETVLRAAAHPSLPHPAPDAPLPAPPALADAAARWRAATGSTRRDERDRDVVRSLHEWAAHSIVAAIRQMLGQTDREGAVGFSSEDLIAAGMAEKHDRLMRVLLPLAATHGLLRPVDDAGPGTTPYWRFRTDPAPRDLFEKALARFPEHSLAFTVFGRCGLHLADVLRGRTDPRELLFAETDRHLIEQFYSRAPSVQTQLDIVRQIVCTITGTWPRGRPLRILEVGAGTGGMTDRLLDVLPPESTEYVYSDVSAVFFPRARRRFADRDFLVYRVVDIDRPLEEQGLAPGSFDLVLAHNALHVAKDVRRAVSRLVGLLAEGGQLVAVEEHDLRSTAVCFGLLDEYWSFTDHELREDSPLLTALQWEDLLRTCGLGEVCSVRVGEEENLPGSSVLLGRRATAPHAHPPEPQDRATGERWIVTAERPDGALAQALTGLLVRSGADDVHRTGLPDDAEQWARAGQSGTGPLHAVIVLDGEQPPLVDADAVTGLAVRRTSALAAFARAYTRSGKPPATLSLVTRSGAPFGAPATPGFPGDAAPWAAARCLANEHPALAVRRIALETGPDGDSGARRLALELLEPTADDEVLLTGGGRFVARSRSLGAARTTTSAGSAPYRLEVRDPGPSHRLAWVPAGLPEPGPDDVLIEVRAVGLNYRDVLEANGMLQPAALRMSSGGQWTGLECAGVVRAVGARVTDLAPGDRVCALSTRAMASHAVASRQVVGRIPDDMDFAAAATLPLVLLTVHYGLGHAARLGRGETLLVHAAAGGVGMAALHFARSCGSTVIATAGTPAKRDLLRLLGVEHVLNSRSLDFAEHVRDRTDGRGVDVVLNSLAGEALVRSAELLAPGGRFIELGKRDIESDSRLAMWLFADNRSFCAVEIGRLLEAGALPAEIVAGAFAEIRRGTCHALPHQSFPANRVDDAFRSLRHSRHVGKVVVTFDEPPLVERTPGRMALAPGGTYLVTGGLSGLGAATARHLADRGAGGLALVGRRGPATPGAEILLEDLAARGVDTRVYAADLGDPRAVEEVLRAVESSGRPLRGVVHAAMVLDDAPLAELSEEQIRAALRPKALGALHLDAACREPLDFFVCYSSATATVGTRMQANYAAGNLFLEALARSRRAGGRHGLTIALGAVSDTGYVAREGLEATLKRTGVGALSSAEACAALDELLATEAAVAVVGRSDWARVGAYLPATNVPRFEGMAPSTGRQGGDDPEKLRQRLAGATADEAVDAVADVLSRAVADVLQTEPGRVDRQRPLDQLGMDSLMAAELVGVVARRLGCEIPAVELINAGSINGLAARALVRLGHGTSAGS
ncbi:Erythronolide synthase, modules 3 and 4 [Streptomyces netropsis]|nr:Erythronolide synthase, modules 3 and 4 [Streptomyces netropsis]